MKPSSKDAISMYFVGWAEKYWKYPEGTTLSTYLSLYLIANYLNMDEVVNVRDENGNKNQLNWYDVQESICDSIQTMEGVSEIIFKEIIHITQEMPEEVAEKQLAIGKDADYKTGSDFVKDINWEEILASTKLCWKLVSMNNPG